MTHVQIRTPALEVLAVGMANHAPVDGAVPMRGVAAADADFDCSVCFVGAA